MNSNKKLIPILALFIVLFIAVGAASAANADSDISVTDANDTCISSDIGTKEINLDNNLGVDADDNKDTDNNVLGDSTTGNFTELLNKIKNVTAGETLELDKNYIRVSEDGDIVLSIDKAITIDAKGYTIDNRKYYNVTIFQVNNNGNLTLKNANLINTVNSTILNNGTLFIENITANNAYIANYGIITSPVVIYVLDNETRDWVYGDTYKLYAAVEAYNNGLPLNFGIPICYGNITFYLNSQEYDAEFNGTAGDFYHYFVIDFVGNKTLNVTYAGATNVSVGTGTICARYGNFTELQKLIDNNTNDVIEFNKSYVRLDGESDIIINKTVTIDGNGFKIDANSLGKIFNVTNDGNLTLKNVKLVNSTEIIYNDGKLFIENITADNNAYIANYGNITSQVVITVLNNETIRVYKGETVSIFGNITACGILVKGINLKFNINGDSLDGQWFDWICGITYVVNFTGKKPVTTTYAGSNNASISNVSIIGIGNGTFTELQLVIDECDDANYTLYQNFTRVAGESDIIINKTITLNGNGFTIDANSLGRIFNITNTGNLTLNNITLKNGMCNVIGSSNNVEGGAIYNNGTLNVANSTFSNCVVTYESDSKMFNSNGGAIYNNYGTLNVVDSTFSNCVATSTSSAKSYVGAFGGAIYDNHGITNITNSTFSNCAVNSTNCFSGTQAFGGAIYATSGNLTVSGSTFSNCVATSKSDSNPVSSRGGAIYITRCNLTVSGSTFSNCSTIAISNGDIIDTGGAICKANNGTMIVSSSIFSNCRALYGGAISISSDNSNVSGSIFDNCTSSRGIIYMSSQKDTGNYTFDGNYWGENFDSADAFNASGLIQKVLNNEGDITNVTVHDWVNLTINGNDTFNNTYDYLINFTGSVPDYTVKVNGKELNITSNGGIYTINATNTTYGVITLNVTNVYDRLLVNKTITAYMTTIVNLTVCDIVYTTNMTGAYNCTLLAYDGSYLGGIENITVNITSDGVEYTSNPLPVGNYNITATFNGNEYLLSNSSTGNFNVLLGTVTSYVVANSSVVYGDNITVNVTIKGHNYVTGNDDDLNGTIKGKLINNNSDVACEFTFNVTNGTGSYVISDWIAAGYYNIFLNFTPTNTNYSNNVNNSSYVNISKFTPIISNITVEIISLIAPVVDYNMTGARETDLTSEAVVTFVNTADGKKYPAGSSLTSGNYLAVVSYAGNENYTAASDNVSFSINTIDVPVFNVSVVCDIYGNVTVNVTTEGVNGENLTGPISLIIDDGELSSGTVVNGSYIGVISGLSVGKHLLNLVFTPRIPDNYNPVVDWIIFGVGCAVPTVNITVDPIVYGEYANISTVVYGVAGEVLGNATTVTVYDENNNTVDVTTILDAGNYTVVAYYAGNENYTDADATGSFSVYRANVTDVFAVNIDPITYGDNIVVKVSDVIGVLGESLNGTVFVNIDSKSYEFNVTDGVGNTTITDLFSARDNYDVKVTFDEDLGNYNSYETTTSLTIAKYTPTVNIDVDNVVYGNDVDVDCEVIGFNDSVISTEYYVVDAYNNPVNLSSSLAVGTYTVVVNYAGNENYTSAYGNKSFAVIPTKVASFVVNVADVIAYGDDIAVDVSALGVNGELLNGTAIITIVGQKYAVNVTNGKGNRTIERILPLGSYDVFAELDIGNYLVAKAYDSFVVSRNNVSSFVVSVNDIVYGDYATITISDAVGVLGESLSGYAIVTIDNVKYNVTVTDGSGSLDIDKLFNAGSYNVGAMLFVGDDNYRVAINSSSFDVAKASTVISASNLTVTAYIGGKLVATLTDIDGNAFAGRNITFVFNGKKYVSTTNAYGKATLAISQNTVGSYPVTMTFAGEDNYNGSTATVTVKVVPAYVTIKQIITAANYLKNYGKKYKKLPSTVKIGSVKCTIAQASYLMTAAFKYIVAKKVFTTKIKVIDVKATTKNTKGEIKSLKTSYIKIFNNLYSKGVKGTLPTTIKVNGKTVGFNQYTFAIAKILSFGKIKYRLPNFVVFSGKYIVYAKGL